MRLATFTTAILLILFATTAYAQTPTPHPDALDNGLYQFEDLNAPMWNLSGTWFSSAAGVMTNISGSQATFFTRDTSDYLIIYRQMSGTGGLWQVCIESLPCRQVSDKGDGLQPVAIELDDTNAKITIDKLDNTETDLDFMQIVPAESAIIATAQAANTPVVIFVPVIATPAATGTPDTISYVESISGTYTRYDNVITPAGRFAGYTQTFIVVIGLSILVVLIWKL